VELITGEGAKLGDPDPVIDGEHARAIVQATIDQAAEPEADPR
jgi:hypothetical protein